MGGVWFRGLGATWRAWKHEPIIAVWVEPPSGSRDKAPDQGAFGCPK